MEKIAHQIEVTVFSKEDEDGEQIKKGFLRLFPFDLSSEKVKLLEDTALGFNEKKIKIYKAILSKNRHTKQFLENLVSLMDKIDIEMVKKQLESRLDDHNHFFIRFDKKNWLEKKTKITDKGNCYHIKISVAAFPATRDNAKAIIEKLLNKETR
ncbi:MAG: RNA-binding domain-containing protein [Candidatus Woesearchaeota archaeon]